MKYLLKFNDNNKSFSPFFVNPINEMFVERAAFCIIHNFNDFARKFVYFS